MKELKNILKEKPKVEDYDCQPYGYINALQMYVDKLEKQLSIHNVVVPKGTLCIECECKQVLRDELCKDCFNKHYS